MRRTLATDPARCVGPCMTLASSSTSPSSLGSPPYPTESSLGSSSTTVTAATTASSVSPPFLRMSMPLSRACNPFALEMINGRLPCAAGATLASDGSPPPLDGVRPNSLPAPAMALPASETRKNLRRDHSSMLKPPGCAEALYRWPQEVEREEYLELENLRVRDPGIASAIFNLERRYSTRNATSGSMRVARRAGR